MSAKVLITPAELSEAIKSLVLYGFKRARASNTLVAHKGAGIKDVGLYFGSRNEWSRDPSLPVEEGRSHAPKASRVAA
jgi:thiosulfate/3-mercaptopyruvate sulfurtransferase